MRKSILTAVLLAACFDMSAAGAATIDLRSISAVGQNEDAKTEQFSPGVPESALETEAIGPTSGQFSSGRARYSENGRSFYAEAEMLRPAETEVVNHRAASYTHLSESYDILTPGALRVSLEVDGFYEVSTDLMDDRRYASFSASLGVSGSVPEIAQEVLKFNTNDTPETVFSDTLVAVFEVDAGDRINIDAGLSAIVGSTFDIPAFLSSLAVVRGTFSITPQDGASFVVVETTPVPVPASLPLLAASLFGFGWLRKR